MINDDGDGRLFDAPAVEATPAVKARFDDLRSVARFHRRDLDALAGLFVEVLALCQRAGMVKLGRVALDGSKVRANASRRKGRSYKWTTEREAKLQVEVDDLLADAEATDTSEDASSSRMAATTSWPAKWPDASRVWPRSAARKAISKPTPSAAPATPDDKAQRNFIDRDARIMKTSEGSFHHCYNAQTVADDAHQVIVTTRLTNRSADCPEFTPLPEGVEYSCGARPRQVLADAGYFSEDNVAAATGRDIDALIATGRLKHDETSPAGPRGRIPKAATAKSAWPASSAPSPGGPATPAAKPSSSRCSARSPPCRAANRACSEGRPRPNGISSPRVNSPDDQARPARQPR